MEFASKHVYIGRDADDDVEVDETLLDAMASSGGLSNVYQQQQQQQQPQQQSMYQGNDNAQDNDSEDSSGGEQQQMQERRSSKSKAAPKAAKKGGFFSRLFGSSSSSNNAAPQQQQQQRQQSSLAPPSAAPASVSLLNFMQGSRRSVPHPLAACGLMDSWSVPPPQAPYCGPGLGGVPGAVCGEPLRPCDDPFENLPASNRFGPPKPKAHKRAVDTNVLAVKFSTLARSAEDLFAGDAILCAGCGAALNHLSMLVDHAGHRFLGSGAASSSSSSSAPAPGGANPPAPAAAAAVALPSHMQLSEGQVFWSCEFCEVENILDGLSAEEVPTGASRDYVLEPAPESKTGADDKTANDAAGDGLILFVLDISGSMCVSSPVPGRFKLRGAKAIDPSLLAFDDVDMSGVSGGGGRGPNVTYVSRLQSVQASIAKQIEDLAVQAPNKKVGLITFNGEVTLIGDGASEPVHITGDKLNDHAALTKIGQDFAGITQSVSTSHSKLVDALFALEETGPTALGPALVASISLASKFRGSTILLCTDGLANVGLGSMTERNVSPNDLAEWYTSEGRRAKEAGVTVSVVSIKGDECKLEAVGLVAAETGGAVERVDPTNIESEFGNMLKDQAIATNVKVTFFLHAGMQFRNEDARDAEKEAAEAAKLAADPAPPAAAPSGLDNLADVASALSDSAPPAATPKSAASSAGPRNKLSRDIGNVSLDSETTLDYGLRTDGEVGKYAHLAALPFQCQIEFTTLTGMRAMRVLTQAQAVTLDRAVAEKDVKLELLSAQVAQKSAALAKEGRYKEARLHWLGAAPMLQRVAQTPQQQQTFSNYATNIDEFDRAMAQQQRLEEAACEEEEAAGSVPAAPGAPSASSMPSAASKSKPAMKKSQMSDENYRAMHKAGRLRSAALL